MQLSKRKTEIIDINILKSNKIADSNNLLENYLLDHPMTWTDGKQYTVTLKKQNLLSSQFTLYTIANSLGQSYQFRWNATGEECTDWTLENISAFALSMGVYVQPYVSYQQAKEIEIKNCATVEEVEAITIDYSAVTA